MTKEQETAITHHCRLATETIHPRFGTKLISGESMVLTVNSGYE